MNNHLEIFQKNTREIVVAVIGIEPSTLLTYTPYLSVKMKATDASTVLFKTGIINDASTGTLSFHLDSVDTSMACKDYVFDVTIVSSSNTLTLAKDIFSIIDNCYV